jgi:hypothetical protein
MMAVLLHKRPDGEIVVHAFGSWLEGVESFWRTLDESYGDSPKSVWEVAEREDEGALAAVGVAGDVVVLTAHGLVLGPDGSYKVVPEGGDPWTIARRRRPAADS